MIREALGLASAAVFAHLLLIALVPMATERPSSRWSHRRSGTDNEGTPLLSTERRLERIERLLVGVDLRLEAMDLRMQLMQTEREQKELRAATESVSSPQPATPRRMANTANSKGMDAPSGMRRATYPIDAHATAAAKGSSSRVAPTIAAGAAAASDGLETPAWLQKIVAEMRREPSAMLPIDSEGANPPSPPAKLQPPRPQSITLAGPADDSAAPKATKRSGSSSGSGSGSVGSSASSGGSRSSGSSSVPSSSVSISDSASATAAPPKQAPRRKRAASKEEDWDLEWEKEDMAQKEAALKPATATGGTSLLEELQKILAGRENAAKERKKDKKGKGSKAKGSHKRAKAPAESADGAASGSGNENEPTAPSESPSRDDDDLIIEDVD